MADLYSYFSNPLRFLSGLLFCTLVAPVGAAASAPGEVFTWHDGLPTQTDAWLSFLETHCQVQPTSRAEFVHEGHALGFRLHLQCPGVALTRWIGLSRVMKDLPLMTRIEAPELLRRYSLVALGLPACQNSVCEETTVLANDIGEDLAVIRYSSDRLLSIQWEFVID
ncbi:MAG: hypothetical protein AAF529_17100 [Pseudomonadota bacterium]